MRKGLFLASCSLALTVFCMKTASPANYDSQAKTSESPQAVLQALMTAFNRHDFAALDRLVAPQGVYEDFAARFRGVGPAAVKRFLRGVIEKEPDFNWQLTSAIQSGSTVAAEWSWTSTFTGQGPDGRHLAAVKVAGRGATVAVIENGQIKELHDYYDDASFFPMAASNGHP